jgi:Ricin-type beta-trefoil lectin domain
MMQRSVRAALYAILTGLLAVSGLAAGVTAANANVAGFCTSSSTATTKANCMIIHTISNPATVMLNVRVTKGANQLVSTAWTASCTLGGDTEKNFGGEAGTTPITETLILPFPDPDSCAVTTSATLGTNNGTMVATLSYAPNPNATPSPTPSPTTPSGPVRLYKGFGGKCLDDKGNSSADRAKVIIWTCNSHDKAQGWTYSGGQLIHNGKCLNDQRSGGNGSKVILYTCNGGANEIWTHKANGQFVLKANGGRYCLDDPANSTRNGTQLIVWTCKGSSAANQRWSAALR